MNELATETVENVVRETGSTRCEFLHRLLKHCGPCVDQKGGVQAVFPALHQTIPMFKLDNGQAVFLTNSGDACVCCFR